MKMMTKQQVFDKVAKHLLAQNKPALLYNDTDDCAYRTRDGLRCAVGCLLTDEAYSPKFEGKNVNHLFESAPAAMAACGLSVDRHAHLLLALQEIHDGAYPVKWRGELARVATYHGLKMKRYRTKG